VNRRILAFTAVGLAAVAVVVAIVLFATRGSHLELRGTIQKVRTLAVEENNSIAIVDFRFTNDADYPYVVKKVTVTFTTQDGTKLEGENIAEIDARRVFEGYPTLGQKYNETLLAKDKIAPKQTADRMIAVRFDAPEAKLQNPKEIRIRIDEVDGAISEIIK
jgi:hypothetical protein